MTKFSDFIRFPGTAGPPTKEGIRALGFALQADFPIELEDYLWVGGAQSFSGPQQLQGRTNIGLGNVDNTSDANKPVSTAQQAALDLKAPIASPTFTGVPAVPTAAPGTNTTQAASTAFVIANPAADGSITNAKLANMAAATVKGRASGAGTGVPTDLVAADIYAIINGLVPPKPTASVGVLGEWVKIAAAANVALVIPSGGTWTYFFFVFTASGGVINNPASGAGVVAGGTTVQAANAALRYEGFAWKVQS